ncbi:hypothetical protein IWQ62_001318 [Dispira parvispora]|uniref:Fungal-type protein kinase domain-containing protein n=1 Tax=Dispira parvispora TaxID=1520584 RepID=A0A9W8E8B1_9FUNG|nr:hypothetical protein IWQ62_001318 [Dispira parvispora]
MLTSTSSKFCSWDDLESYQERNTETADDTHKQEIEHAIERTLQRDVPNLVSKVVGFEELGEYEGVAGKVDELITLSTKRASQVDKRKGLDQQKRMLCNNAYSWLNLGQKDSKPITEHTMYLCVIDYLFLIGMVLAGNTREAQGTTIQRRILPHAECDVRSNPDANTRHDFVLRCCDTDVDVQQEYEPFKPDSNLPEYEYGPDKKQKVDKSKPTEGEDLDKFRDQIKDAFGFVKVKISPKDDAKLKTYAKLGQYVRCALNAQFDRHGMWTITVCGPFVRFVLFTHSTVIPSTRIDMSKVKGRKQFVDDYIRLSVCPKYRVGYDHTKTWLPCYERWEVECFNTNRDENKQGAEGPCASVYVDPKPITSRDSLFGRRTRCHLASLTKSGKLEYVLKESWTEVDGNFNRMEMPNEVWIFNHIEERDRQLEEPLTGNGIPKMMYGGTVCIKTEYVHGDTGQTGQWCYDTTSRYCGELKANGDDDSNHCPSTSQGGPSANPGNTDNVIKSVERVHQRLLLTPVGKSMATLHPYGTQPSSEVPVELNPEKAWELCKNVLYFFKKLFLVIYRLHEDYGIYHRDLSEGNVLVVKSTVTNSKYPYETAIAQVPLLIDFDHARHQNDDVSDPILSRTGTLPFMSILNLAGRTDKLSFLDECESFLYLFLWKCTIGFARHQVSPSDVRTEARSVHGGKLYPKFQRRLVHQWVSSEPLDTIEDVKRNHMDSQKNFAVVLKALRPEFQHLKLFLHKLRHALFTWEGGSGALQDVVFQSGDETELPPTIDLSLDDMYFLKLGNSSGATTTVENGDPLVKRFDHRKEVAKKFYTVMVFEYTT